MPRWLTNLLVALVVIGIPPFLILSNLYVFMTPSYLDFEYGKPGFPKADRFNDAERRANAAASIEYVRGNLSFEHFKALGVYNEREIKHMVDVRELVAKVTVFHAVEGVLLLIALIALAWSRATRALAARGLLGGTLLTLALFGVLGLFAVIAFNTFFTAFHRVFFEGDSWRFNYSDSLIQFYPLPFWFDTAVALVALTMIEALTVGAIVWWWQRQKS
ncbi:MAG: TIGR01906 family membrane protein [Chloroflexota bacterium]|jgi:integral membrane protein (TIGR01906 family)